MSNPKVIYFNVVTPGQFTVNPRQDGDSFNLGALDTENLSDSVKAVRELDRWSPEYYNSKLVDTRILLVEEQDKQKSEPTPSKLTEIANLEKKIKKLQLDKKLAEQDSADKRYAYFDTPIPGSVKSLAELWREEFLSAKNKLNELILKTFQGRAGTLVLCFDGDPPGSPPAVLVHYLFTIFSKKPNLDVQILQCQTGGSYDLGVFMDTDFPCSVDDYDKQCNPGLMPKLYDWLRHDSKLLLTNKLTPIEPEKFNTILFKSEWAETYSGFGKSSVGEDGNCTNLPNKAENIISVENGIVTLLNDDIRTSTESELTTTRRAGAVPTDQTNDSDVKTANFEREAMSEGRKKSPVLTEENSYSKCVAGNLSVWNHFFKHMKLFRTRESLSKPKDQLNTLKDFIKDPQGNIEQIITDSFNSGFKSKLLISNNPDIVTLLGKTNFTTSMTSQTFKWALEAEAAGVPHLQIILTDKTPKKNDTQYVDSKHEALLTKIGVSQSNKNQGNVKSLTARFENLQYGGSRKRKRTRKRSTKKRTQSGGLLKLNRKNKTRSNKRVSKSRRSIKRRQRRSIKLMKSRR